MKRFVFSAMLAVAATAAQAQTPPAKVDAGTYTVDSHHTQILFSINHMGFSTFHGVFPNATGSLTLDPANPGASAGTITVPMADLDTTNAKLNGELVSPDWFDATQFPTATFKITKVTSTGNNAATIDGDLTLHGVTKPVSLAAHLIGSGTNPMMKKMTVGFDATTTIKRTDFGVTKFSPMIGDNVELTISVAAQK